MKPSILSGDIVIYRPLNSDLSRIKKGSLVIIEYPCEPKTLLVKRVISKTELSIAVQGDNEEESTDSRHFGLVNVENIRGVIEKVIPRKR